MAIEGLPTAGMRQGAAAAAESAQGYFNTGVQARLATIQAKRAKFEQLLQTLALLRQREDQKRAQRGEDPSVGGMIGMGVGAVAGGIVGGPAGAITGAQLGGTLGGGVDQFVQGDTAGGVNSMLAGARNFVPNPIASQPTPGQTPLSRSGVGSGGVTINPQWSWEQTPSRDPYAFGWE